ncbi:hypothetical protein [Puia sp.]|jgi:hypothetical protein|uniref:hypothetical protein n=1 Tax=Puia sp. TaxID=2045100 RepID=UPI002F429E0F
MSSSLPVLPNGIQHIALSFSGGGYRAASFTLGCVSYLNRTHYAGLPLFHRVKFISSASGGSITNLVLCSMLREGKRFEDVYKHLVGQMQGCQLVDAVFAVWNDERAWVERPDKTRNFINAFSLVYDRELFKGQTFGVLWEKPANGGFVVEECCVNATEFNNGLNFRFGTKGELGNDFLHFRASGMAAAKKIRLADILACSSCFTAGFEPVMFPCDFTWTNAAGSLTEQELSAAIVADNTYNESSADVEDGIQEIGFMDGGIDDNQGIYAFSLADDRKKGYDYDLYIPCDVSSNYLSKPFRYPKIKDVPLLKRSLTDYGAQLKRWRVWYGVGCLIGLTLAVALLAFGVVPGLGWLLLGFSLAAMALPAGLFLVLRKKLRGVLHSVFPPATGGEPKGMFELVFKKHLGAFLKMPLRNLVAILAARGSSVVLLATTIFLKKIRRVSYTMLFKEKGLDVYRSLVNANNALEKPGKIEAGRLWNDHIAMTAVYQLSTKNAAQLKKDLGREPWGDDTEAWPGQLLDEFIPPSDKLRAVVDIATEMGTTLWFDMEDQERKSLPSLLAAGQATICFNLLRVSFRFGNADPEWLELRKRLVEDWKRFKEEPYWLYNEYSRTAGNKKEFYDSREAEDLDD